jgi:hypothetical protein
MVWLKTNTSKRKVNGKSHTFLIAMLAKTNASDCVGLNVNNCPRLIHFICHLIHYFNSFEGKL